MLLHLFGYGDLFDSVLLRLYQMPQESREVLLPVWALVVYAGVSIGAIWSQKLFWLVLSLAALYMIDLFIFV